MSSAPVVEAAQGFLLANRDVMTELLQDLVRAESPSQVAQTQSGVLRILSVAMDSIGFDVRHHAGRRSGGLLVAHPGQRTRSAPLQLLVGHADTVWPEGTLETMPLQIEGTTLRGPGAFDMKAGLVQGIYACAAARAALGAWPEVMPVFVINTDEEIGSRESTHTIRRFARIADRAFVLEPSLGPRGALKTTRKGIGRFTVSIRGVAAHAGLDPGKGVSAILELTHVVQALFALNDPARGVTVNVGTIDGGLQANVVAPESRAVVDVRVPTAADAKRVEEAIRALRPTLSGTSVHVEGAIGRPPMESTPGNQRLWRLTKRLAADELDLELEHVAAGGGSDGNTTSQFTPTLDGLGPVGDGAHARHEHLDLSKMVERATLLACLLMQPPLENP